MASQAPPALGPVPLPVAEAEADRAKRTKRNFIFGFLSEDSKVERVYVGKACFIETEDLL